MISLCGHLERNNDFFINYLIISPFNLIEYYSSLLKSPPNPYTCNKQNNNNRKIKV